MSSRSQELLWAWCGAVAAFLACTGSVAAFVGEQDVAGKFPHVVQLSMQWSDGTGALCTGVIGNGGLVSTAAHCVWKDGVGLSSRVSISYRGLDGTEHSVRHKKIFIPKLYAERSAQWRKSKTEADFHRMTLQDIAFVMPAEPVITGGLKNWISEALSHEVSAADGENLAHYSPGASVLTSTFKQKIVADIAREIDVDNAQALVVGFGNNKCKDFMHDVECTSDGLRRFGEVPLQRIVVADNEKFEEPWIWCTGPDNTGLSPIRSGDSGGPMFIRARDGRWLFAGHISGGNNRQNCASSLLSHLDLWREAVTYYAENYGGVESHTPLERQQRARAIVREYLEVMSADNETTLRRLAVYHREKSPSVLNLKPVSFEQYMANRRNLVERWPKRTYKLVEGTPFLTACIMQRCRTSAQVEWTLSDDKESHSGTYQFDALMNTAGYESDWLNVSGPRFDVEIFHPLSEDGKSFAKPTQTFVMQDYGFAQDADIVGGDLYPKGLRQVSIEQCFNLCAFNTACHAMSWVRGKDWCWLKGTYQGTTAMQGVVSHQF